MLGLARAPDTECMRVKVWMDAWQQQCCGEPFSVGTSISWNLIDRDLAWLAPVIGADEVKRIRFAEDHHAEADTGVRTSAVVTSIYAVLCQYEPSPNDDPRRFQHPMVPGSQTLDPVATATGWESESDTHTFVGYLVELEL